MSGENLAFEHFFAHSGEADAGFATALAIDVAAGDKSIWSAFHPMQVARVGVMVITAIVYGTTPTLAVVAFDRRVTFASNTGRVEMGRVTIPESAPAGAVFYVDIPNGPNKDNGELIAGGQVVSEVVVAGLGGTVTGTFQPFIVWVPRSLQPANSVNGAGVVTMTQDITTVQV
jgi:hypothetical protein